MTKLKKISYNFAALFLVQERDVKIYHRFGSRSNDIQKFV